ncbi:hypothetical protein RAA17_16840 [Komagataeibacter rhaeticus]|nr:hypothetical protein [Komagataeibacter rhaeticus]
MTRPARPFRAELGAILAIAGPMGLSQFTQMLMGLTDDVLLGGIGAQALAIGAWPPARSSRSTPSLPP